MGKSIAQLLQLRLPNLTFAKRFSIQGAKRAAEVIACGAGHTQSDAILFLPDDGVVFMGDLLFVGYQPYLGAGDPDQLLRILEMVGTLDADTFVPGHGPVGHRSDLALMAQYIDTLHALARQLVAEGQTADHIDAMSIPKPFGDWLYASFFGENLRFLYQRQLERREGIENPT